MDLWFYRILSCLIYGVSLWISFAILELQIGSECDLISKMFLTGFLESHLFAELIR